LHHRKGGWSGRRIQTDLDLPKRLNTGLSNRLQFTVTRIVNKDIRRADLRNNLLKRSPNPGLVEDIDNDTDNSRRGTDLLDLLLCLGQRLGRASEERNGTCARLGECECEALALAVRSA
jgi:hypothetical protein